MQEQRRYISPKQFLERERQNGTPWGRQFLYNQLSLGHIPHIRIGQKILIPEDALDQLLAGFTPPCGNGHDATP